MGRKKNSSPKNRTKAKEKISSPPRRVYMNALFIKIHTRQIVTSSEKRSSGCVRGGGREEGGAAHKREPEERLSSLRFVVVVVVLRCTHVESFIVSFRWTILPEQFPEVERLPLWLRSGRFAPSNRRNCRLWGGGFKNREFNTRKTGIWRPCTW